MTIHDLKKEMRAAQNEITKFRETPCPKDPAGFKKWVAEEKRLLKKYRDVSDKYYDECSKNNE